MKLLFVNDFEKPDYQNDMVYHGLVNTPGLFVYETSWPRYMLAGYPNPGSLYGRGFTLYARMMHTPKLSPSWVVEEKIKDKYYDLIVYGSINRSDSFLDSVLSSYPASKIVFIDGEDEDDISRPDLLNKGHYFKRELYANTDGVRPIGFSIPKELVLEKTPKKTKAFANVVVSYSKNYQFDNEQDYYSEYQRACFAVTQKKAGYDCLRHYEILANGCIPIFSDIDKIPETTMVNFPKQFLKDLYSKLLYDVDEDSAVYPEAIQTLLDYTREHLTTVKVAKRILEQIVS